MLNRRQFLSSTLALPAWAQPQKRPNIIFILADDLGWGDLGCYGNREIATPNLDRLATGGAQFTQFYTSNPVCSPSRTGFMTGQYPARHQIHGHLATHQLNAERGMPNFLNPEIPFLPRLLQKSGYATAHFGKWHLGSGEGAPKPDAYGFEVTRTINSNGAGWADQNTPQFRARSTELIADEAIAFMTTNRNRPFYMNAWTLVPHAILNPTAEQMGPYQRYAPGGGIPHKGAKQIFYASVTDLDTQVGRLLAKLDQLDLTSNTLILFSSDNGPEDIHIVNASHSAIGSPGPFRGRKRSLYEGGVRVPFLARLPGRIPAGRVDTRSVLTAVDFMPTLTKLAAAATPSGHKLDGEDVSDILSGKSRPRERVIHWEWRFRVHGYHVNRSPILAIREGDWKLLLNPDRSRVELYNIPADPSEMTNLAQRKPDMVDRMAKAALQWQKELPAGPVDPDAGKNDYPMPKERLRHPG